VTTRAALDTGSGQTLIRGQLLPRDTPLACLEDLARMSCDVNRGWLPIIASVHLGVTLCGQTTYL